MGPAFLLYHTWPGTKADACSINRFSIATPENIESIKARGQALWDTIYQPHAVKLYNKLGGYHPDFIGASQNNATAISPSVQSPPLSRVTLDSLARPYGC